MHNWVLVAFPSSLNFRRLTLSKHWVSEWQTAITLHRHESAFCAKKHLLDKSLWYNTNFYKYSTDWFGHIENSIFPPLDQNPMGITMAGYGTGKKSSWLTNNSTVLNRPKTVTCKEEGWGTLGDTRTKSFAKKLGEASSQIQIQKSYFELLKTTAKLV